MISVLRKIKMNRKQIVGVVIFVVIATFGQLLAPSMVSTMISDGVNNNDYTLIIGLAIAIIIISVVACLTNIVSTY